MEDYAEKIVDPLFTSERHKDLQILVSLILFSFDESNDMKIGEIVSSNKETLKDVVKIYRYIAIYDMSFEKRTDLCKK